jgi:cytochrome c oxidase assembly factor CtaG
LALAMSSHNPFPSYLNSMRSPNEILSDIHLGGAIMWIGGDALMLLLLIPLVVRWLKFETIRTKQIDAELRARLQTRQARRDLPRVARPGE